MEPDRAMSLSRWPPVMVRVLSCGAPVGMLLFTAQSLTVTVMS